jgi:mono/diheme cytochrome c family protein
MRALRVLPVGLVVVLLAIGAVLPAFAGGWAVVTLDSLPEDVVSGDSITIGFTVRQHGITPISDLDPSPQVTAENVETGEVIQSTAAPDGGRGHYSANLTLPTPGEWEWEIRAFGGQDQPMPPIYVTEAAPPPLDPVGRASPAALGVVCAGLAVLGVGLAVRRRFVASGIAIVVAAVGVVSMGGSPPASPTSEAVAPVVLERGAALFVAKGCVVCHVNGDLPGYEPISLSIGPDLTHYSNDPAFLGRWLENPAAVRPATAMPGLGLSPAEIDALIAFLNGEGPA